MELKGRTALVTGSCGEGMGRSIALRLAREGANVVLNYGTRPTGAPVRAAVRRIASAVQALGGRAMVHEGDTTDEGQVSSLVEAARSAFGSIEILVNNAGGEWIVRDYAAIPLAHWRRTLAAEIDGPFLLMKHVVPEMRRHRWGRIIHIGMEGALGFRSMKGKAPDACLGKAVRAWMTAAFGRPEFRRGITVNCIEPGITAHMSFPAALRAAKGDHATWRRRRKLTCHDIAEIVAFLCSDAARFVSGSIIRLPYFP